MLKSMTGFGRHEIIENGKKITVEMKSVNHRYCEISVKLPKKINFFETAIRSLLKEYISRGKVDVYIFYEDETERQFCVRYNEGIAKEYQKYFEQMSINLSIENDIKVSDLARFPDVFLLEEQVEDEEVLWKLLEQALKGAAEKFVAARTTEGAHLKEDILGKLDFISEKIDFIEERAPELITEYRNKVMGKVEELLGDTKIDEGVLATELVVFADKVCVDEETVRLRSHIKHMKDTLEDAENIGRKLDFIAQEMNREANTILSKANDIEISNCAIDMKTEIEKIREQIQNIE